MWISILCRKIDFWASAHTRTVIRQLDLKVPFAGGVYNGQFNEVECNCHHLHSRLAKNGLGIISAITIIEIFAHFRSLHSNFLCKLWFLFRKNFGCGFFEFQSTLWNCINHNRVCCEGETPNQNWYKNSKNSDPNNKSHISRQSYDDWKWMVCGGFI